MLKLYKEIRIAARSGMPVFLHGDTGVGKELVARELHRISRRPGPFIAINCANLERERADADLFGHEKGAFTDAHSSNLGLIRTAEKGVLFLDEIAELSPPVQAKLLRFLDNGTVTPLGAAYSVSVDVVVVTATHKNLADLIERGEFREDLYFRLCDITIRVPSLNDRRSDIPLLVKHFARLWSEKHGRDIEVPKEVIEALVNYNWRGNIRELRAKIERAASHLEEGEGQVMLSMFDLDTPERETADTALIRGLWSDIRGGNRIALTELARRHGRPVATGVAELAIKEAQGVRNASLYFDMSYGAFRAWISRERRAS